MATKQAKKTTAKKVTAKKVTAKKAPVKTEAVSARDAILEAVNTNVENVQDVAKKFWLAGLGAFGRSVDEVQTRYTEANEELTSRYEQASKDRQKLVKELIKRGEKVQVEAEERVKEGRANIEEQIELAKDRLTGLVSVVDIPARLQDVSDKLENLSKDLKKSA